MQKQPILELRKDADRAKYLYNTGEIDYEEMLDVVGLYIDECNVVAKRLAKEYEVRPKTMTVRAFLR